MTAPRRITDPIEAMAQRVAERVVDLVLQVVDVNALLARVDVDKLVRQTDLGAVIARSSGGAVSEVLDAGRSTAVGLDRFIDRWVQRALRRKQPAPVAPRALLDGQETPPEATEAPAEAATPSDEASTAPAGVTPPEASTAPATEATT